MDNLSLFIIAVSILLAVLFKWVLVRKIQHWMERDLINQLASGDPQKQAQLEQARQHMIATGVHRTARQEQLTLLATGNEPD